MTRLEKIQRFSGVLRYLLLLAAGAIACAIVFALFVPGQDWVTVGDSRLARLLEEESVNRAVVAAVAAPLVIIVVLGIYWLQRLFGEYQAGNFFTDDTLRCYLWLVWLKAAAFVYGFIWPVFLARVPGAENIAAAGLSFDAGAFLELVVLVIIVHILREAHRLHDENRAFV